MLRRAVLAKRPCVACVRHLHKSAVLRNEPKSDKTPVQVFFETFSKELKKSKELQNDIKALQDETGRLSESAAFKRAKEALEKSNKARSATEKVIGKAGEAVGTAAAVTWNSAPVKATRDVVSKTADAVDRAAAPMRETTLYKDVKDVIDDGSSLKYGGFESKEERRKRHMRDLMKQREAALGAGHKGFVKANEKAGGDVVLHENASREPKTVFAETSLGRKLNDLKLAFEESDNGLVSAVRSVTEKIGWFFQETESGRVERAFRLMDPSFTQEGFVTRLRTFILPEVLEAYVCGDEKVLKQWLSEAAFSVWQQTTKEYRDKGLYSASQILDIRGSDIVQAKMIAEAEIPIYVISCRAQETNVYKKVKTDEIAAGVPDKVLMTTYVMMMTRDPEKMNDEETLGWRILDMARGRSQNWH